jgi:hypothetical protein
VYLTKTLSAKMAEKLWNEAVLHFNFSIEMVQFLEFLSAHHYSPQKIL